MCLYIDIRRFHCFNSRAFNIVCQEDLLLEIGISILGRHDIKLCEFGITIKK